MISNKYTINVNGSLVEIDHPLVMGIVNITPDSFFSGSRFVTEKEIIDRTQQIIDEGGSIVDIGAYSTRPGAEYVDEATEKARLKVALTVIRANFPEVIISLDTFRAEIARWTVEKYNIGIVNDISGGTLDEKMFQTVASLKVPYILMHMRGNPSNMNDYAVYNDVVKEVIFELSEKVDKLKEMGVSDIIIDPGFGFAKTLEQNYQLLNKLEVFQFFDLPVLVGISRKSMIYRLLQTNPEQAINGTTALNTIALLKGAKILRVHDVKEAVETVKIVSQLSR
ncbi:MAG TPA: dihydropteroate synthase [Bacteroidales bacterium]|nr:dihydropteroate synthase [Bacteroidales bacterium]